MADEQARFLSPAEVVKRWGHAVSVGTLKNWRGAGKGPAYQKFGSRVRYPAAQLETWEAENLHANNENSEGKK